MPQTYFIVPTAAGEAKMANAQALGLPFVLTDMGVGDGNGALPVPDRNRTTLLNERRRAALNTLAPDGGNPGQYVAEQVIPENVGGWWIRELGLYDADGTLCFYGNCPESYKPQLAEGSGRTQVVRMVVMVTGSVTVELKVDPSIVLATRAYCDTAIEAAMQKLDNKQSVVAASTANLAALSGLLTVDGVTLAAGNRVLVKNQAAAKDNGIYVAAAGAWPRAADADSNDEVTPGLVVYVERGTAQADTIWKLTTDTPIVVGTTALTFADITNGYARSAGDAAQTFAVAASTGGTHAVPRVQLLQNYAWHHKIDLVTASGDYTVPTDVYFLDVELWGGGGGGGGTATAGSSGPGGGGGGGYSRKIVAVTPGQVIACTVGAGGSGGLGGGYGGNAGTTSFGAMHSATGGLGGAPNGVGGGGAAGTGTGGDLNSSGAPGGGGHASGYSGSGGGAPFGGPGGNGASGAAAGGAVPGGGGPGRGTSSVGNGGAGANGLIIIRY